jgi:hypothetical protein
MPDYLVTILFIVAYFALMKWILPRAGVPT